MLIRTERALFPAEGAVISISQNLVIDGTVVVSAQTQWYGPFTMAKVHSKDEANEFVDAFQRAYSNGMMVFDCRDYCTKVRKNE